MNFKMKSIKWKIMLWIVVASIVLLGILTVFIYMQVNQTVDTMVNNNAIEIAKGRAGQVSEWIKTNLKAIEMAANTNAVKSLDKDVIEEYLNERRSVLGDGFETLYVVDLKGQGRTAAGADVDLSSRDYIKKIYNGNCC